MCLWMLGLGEAGQSGLDVCKFSFRKYKAGMPPFLLVYLSFGI